MLQAGRVKRMYAYAGAPVCDITTPNGGLFLKCAVMQGGAGTPNQGLHLPLGGAVEELKKGANVIFATYLHNPRKAVVLGALPGNDVISRFYQDDETVPDASTDPSVSRDAKKTTTQAATLRNNGGCVLVLETGALILDTQESGQPVQVQVGSAPFRVTKNGDSATEGVPLAGPTRDQLDAHTDAINALQTTMTSVLAALQAMQASYVVLNTIAPITPMPASDALSALSGVPAAVLAFKPSVLLQTTDDMVSGAMEISAVSKNALVG